MSLHKSGPTLLCILILLGLTRPFLSSGQDTHYWTYRYGTRAALMGGSAVGGLADNSSVVYNPALLSFVQSSSVSLNSNAYQIVSIRSKDGAGKNLDVASSQFSAVPITVSGLIPKKRGSRITMGYALLVPTEFNFKSSAYTSGPKNIVVESQSPGAEDFVGQFTINSHLSENMAAFAIAYKLDSAWSVGLTNQFTYRAQNYGHSELARMILNNTGASLVSTSESASVEYAHLRFSPKLGIAHQGRHGSFGLVVTLPSTTLFGSGTLSRDFVANNLLINTETNPAKPANFQRSNLAANDRQENLPVTFKSPLSIAFGFVHRFNRSTLAFTTEWFGSTGLYDLISAPDQSFRRPTNLPLNGDTFMRVNASAVAVMNVALGFERDFTPGFTMSMGMRTNMSTYDPVFTTRIDQRFQKQLNDNPINLDISTWDIFTGTWGGTFRKERRDITVGINYSFALDRSLKQFANFDNPTEPTFLLGQRTNSTVHFYSVGLLLGYTFRFRAEPSK
ncbi:MAG TPA: hypothetical protein PK059_10950 [Cyclobacteriaceae bacterium]|nr:hypothetical protein [Cyclobacteriaceae bacterium]